jgi:DNA-binding transcriptional LysR family regulator
MIDEMPGDFMQWLRGFYSVAEQGSVTQATRLMGREQPTITRQIKCLEKQLGVTLFDRSSGAMKMTAEGRVLRDKVIRLFDDVQEIEDEFKKGALEYQGHVVIAASNAIINSFLPHYIEAFLKTHPAVTFHLEGCYFEDVYEKIESGEADFGIAFANLAPNSIECHDLYEAGMKLIARKGLFRFPDGRPTLEQIAATPLILVSQTGKMESIIMQRFEAEGLMPNARITLSNFQAVKTYVAMGLGVALLTSYVLTKQDEPNLDIYDMSEFFPKRKVSILIKKRKYLSPAVSAFLRTIKPDFSLPGGDEPPAA